MIASGFFVKYLPFIYTLLGCIPIYIHLYVKKSSIFSLKSLQVIDILNDVPKSQLCYEQLSTEQSFSYFDYTMLKSIATAAKLKSSDKINRYVHVIITSYISFLKLFEVIRINLSNFKMSAILVQKYFVAAENKNMLILH